MKNWTVAVKGFLAAAGAAVMALQPVYGKAHWFEGVIGVLAALGVAASENHQGTSGGSGSGPA